MVKRKPLRTFSLERELIESNWLKKTYTLDMFVQSAIFNKEKYIKSMTMIKALPLTPCAW